MTSAENDLRRREFEKKLSPMPHAANDRASVPNS